jgi:GNAT superfamily N-acetyltransferase
VGIVIRLVRSDDRERLGRALSRVWDGNDYIPLVFDRWVRDGGFYLAVRGRRIVGCGKVTEFAPDELWLEGLRVDPRLHGRGFGTDVSRRIILAALDRRPRSLRFATGETNRASLAIVKHQAFRLIARPQLFNGVPPPAADGPEPVRPRVDEVLDYLRASEELRLNRGLLARGWLFRELDRRYTVELFRAGATRGVRQGKKLTGLLVMQPQRRDERNIDICHVSGSARAQEVLRRFVGRCAAARGSQALRAMATGNEMAGALARLGLKPATGFRQALVFEYNI